MRHEEVDIAICGRVDIIYVTYAARAGRHSKVWTCGRGDMIYITYAAQGGRHSNVWTCGHNIRHICSTRR